MGEEAKWPNENLPNDQMKMRQMTKLCVKYSFVSRKITIFAPKII
jgi:hypothetical protein